MNETLNPHTPAAPDTAPAVACGGAPSGISTAVEIPDGAPPQATAGAVSGAAGVCGFRVSFMAPPATTRPGQYRHR